MKVTNNNSQTIEIKGKSVQSVAINGYAIASLVNVNAQTGCLVWKFATLEVILIRDGIATTIVSGRISDLVSHFAFLNAGYKIAQGLQSITHINHGVSTKGEYISPVEIPLDGVINLAGDDLLTVKVTANAGIFGNVNLYQSNSYLDFYVTEGIGREYYTPQTLVKLIPSGEGNPTYSLGDDVTAVTFVNLDKLNANSTDQVLQGITLNSDKLKVQDNYAIALVKRSNDFEDLVEANARAQSFAIARSAVGLHNCEIALTANGANVTSGNNAIVYTKHLMNKSTYLKALNKEDKHSEREHARFGIL